MSRVMKVWVALVLAVMAGAVAGPSYASFVNGGFESGDFTGWTKNGGTWGGPIGQYNFTGDPGKSAIVGVGFDPIVTAGGGSLPMVYNGSYAARVNDGDSYYTGWGGYHFSSIEQVVAWSDPDIYFAWAAVLEEPGHVHDREPHFWLKLEDVTTNTVLYQALYAADTLPGSLMHPIFGGNWKYTDWQVIHLDTSGVIGDTLKLTLIGSDCGQGGHSGYVYLDGFGAVPPPPPDIPEPCTLLIWSLLGALAVTTGWWRSRRRDV